MTGAMSRNKGERAMRAVVDWLRSNGHPYASKRGAGDHGDDIVDGIPGISIEIKDHARMELAAWIDQALEQSMGRPAVVVHKRRGRSNAGEWYATTTLADFARIVEPEGRK